MGVVEVGEPLDLGRNIGQPVELGGGREPVGARFRSATAPRVGLRTWAEFSLIIGFDDKTLEPDVGHAPVDVRAPFYVDKIQTIVSRYSFDLFEVAVGFGQTEAFWPIYQSHVGFSKACLCSSSTRVPLFIEEPYAYSALDSSWDAMRNARPRDARGRHGGGLLDARMNGTALRK
jgi:hypothetical protein